MSSVNKVILIGHVGKDPEIRSSQSGSRFANFNIATSESWKDKTTGERKERTEWHNISVTNDSLVSVVERFIKKGSKVYVEGQLQTRKWQHSDGSDRYSTEVVLKPFNGEIVLMDKKPEGESAFNEGSRFAEPSYAASNKAQAPSAPTSFAEDLDDERGF